VLDYRIKELKRQIEPREREIRALRKQIKEVDAELEEYHALNARLDEKIGDHRKELADRTKQLSSAQQKLQSKESSRDALLADLETVSGIVLEHDQLRERMQAMCNDHVPKDLVIPKESAEVKGEYER